MGDISRFEDDEKLVACAGIDASVSQCGNFEGTQMHMSKRGQSRWHNAETGYSINKGFIPIALNYDSETNSSRYNLQGMQVIIKGGFVKGIQVDDKKQQWLVIRALSPLPEIQVIAGNSPQSTLLLRLENVNPVFYTAQIKNSLSIPLV